MEAASPPLELLPDLPVEEPLDPAMPARAAPAAASPAATSAQRTATASIADGERGDLDFLDPEMFLDPGPDDLVTAPPAAPPATARPAHDGLELVLEDPVVDELLTTLPPPAPPAPKPLPPAAPVAAATGRGQPTPGSAPKAAALPAATRDDLSTTSRVPILKTPSLSAAAYKLAAASAANQRARVPGIVTGQQNPQPAAAAGVRNLPYPVPPPPPAKPVAARIEPAAPPAPAAPKPPLADAISRAPPRPAPTPKPVAAAPLTPVPVAPPTPVAKAPAASPSAEPPAQTAAAAAPEAATAAPMDYEFIVRNQVVERYLAGRLPVKGATDFERFVRENPQLLDQIGLPERVNAGLRLLEASGKPEPWQEAKRTLWQKPQLSLGLAAGLVALAVAIAVIGGGSVSKTHRIEELQKEVHDRALDPATSTRDIRLLPSRTGPAGSPALTIGGTGAGAQLADFRIDESHSPYHAFKITIDRLDQGRVGVINNVGKDSNGDLRIALNSSALGPGRYQLTLEGLDWRGDPQPDSWITIGISR
jgi:hypothetical protein